MRIAEIYYSGREFLLTPLREGRPGTGKEALTSEGNFYSRPCGRGDASADTDYTATYEISTHAPAGGATALTIAQIQDVIISTHAPAGGATCVSYAACILIISTHAPAGGATEVISSFAFLLL